MTHLAHEGHGGGIAALLQSAVIALLVAGYLVLARRVRREPRGWSRWRTASVVAGGTLLMVAMLPPVATFAEGDFRGHMLQHLLIGMLAPTALVLGAPLTLLLRSLPPPHRRRVARVLHSRAVRAITNPWLALVLNVGGMAALYFTPLYRLVADGQLSHHLVHLHFVIAGCLFAWVVAGPDPAPRRPSVRMRLVVLGMAITSHATLAQLMYAGLFIDVRVPVVELHGAAEIMYYGGDIAELLLAMALLTTWRPMPRRARQPMTVTTTAAATSS
ncbi:cytochrome c oxidase assembly protein [Microtetraspora sp. NBRC 16547]|uniref:cytochrome c oxidase assembly protein n=1 Tax=Microtetraspora sp. NBRC 16547 TaxID=3030993 RepID=UPI0024A1C8E9|nr:cytochrome c oxidase assembly protein [Microtetraspora sp. NBRC 16547]GLX02179.1 membrane protein [Microtetraspora sp. NBRC 16547]